MSWVLCPVSCSSAGVSRCLSVSGSDLAVSSWLSVCLSVYLCWQLWLSRYASHTYASAMLCRGPDVLLWVGCCSLVLALVSGGGVDHRIISFEGGGCTKVEQRGMRSVRLGTFPWAMTGRDKLRQDMAGLGRTGHSICLPLSVPMFLMVIAMRRHSQQVYALAPHTSPFSLQKFEMGIETRQGVSEWQ